MATFCATPRRAWLTALLLGAVGGIMASVTPAAAAAASSDWHRSVRDFAAKHFKNPAWGYSHCLRDYALARELAAADHVTLDDDVLFAAAYLHDMAAARKAELAQFLEDLRRESENLQTL